MRHPVHILYRGNILSEKSATASRVSCGRRSDACMKIETYLARCGETEGPAEDRLSPVKILRFYLHSSEDSDNFSFRVLSGGKEI